MRVTVDALWNHLHTTGVSWIGFYIPDPDDLPRPSETPPAGALVLGPSRDTPACSPIGLHGACGIAFRTRAAALIDDIKTLGPNYIACDPRDASEAVIPLIDAHGHATAVLDADSHDTAAFDESDIAALHEVLRAAALTHPDDLTIVRY